MSEISHFESEKSQPESTPRMDINTFVKTPEGKEAVGEIQKRLATVNKQEQQAYEWVFKGADTQTV